jgi:hypothetical protein
LLSPRFCKADVNGVSDFARWHTKSRASSAHRHHPSRP